jgi:hypothetical protein
VTTRCTNCDATIPEGGKFCIECGRPAPQPATGPTERLAEHEGGPRCAFCGTRNPPGAIFCVTCGQGLTARPFAEPPANPSPGAPVPAPLSSASAAPAAPARRGGLDMASWGGVTGGLFLIGIAVLAVTGWWWPGILVLVGLTSLVTGLAGGRSKMRAWAGVQAAFWLFGLALIAMFNWWWPGILVLVGLSVIVGSLLRPKF